MIRLKKVHTEVYNYVIDRKAFALYSIINRDTWSDATIGVFCKIFFYRGHFDG